MGDGQGRRSGQAPRGKGAGEAEGEEAGSRCVGDWTR